MQRAKRNAEIGTKEDAASIDQKLGAFNQAALSFSGDPEKPIAYVIKKSGEIIAGISGCIDWAWILHVELLFIDEKYRCQGMGSYLLNKIEAEAKALNAGLAQTDTFDFQAKNFYIKHGYKVFGIVDDSPRPGHRRYYLKKILHNNESRD